MILEGLRNFFGGGGLNIPNPPRYATVTSIRVIVSQQSWMFMTTATRIKNVDDRFVFVVV